MSNLFCTCNRCPVHHPVPVPKEINEHKGSVATMVEKEVRDAQDKAQNG